ncbi:hypothetical protein KOY_00035 [Bacillus cereus VDM021]|nr:hypothetical protein KOY_00035 [Bacillus cereus VDM021]
MMKKIILTAVGFAFTLSITAGFSDFNNVALNKGDTGGAPSNSHADFSAPKEI